MSTAAPAKPETTTKTTTTPTATNSGYEVGRPGGKCAISGATIAPDDKFIAALRETATGFDVHRFTAGDGIMICGIRIPHEFGLEGHSDADVGLHALTDALLGTIGAGDIGMHFPPSDERWRGADSSRFIGHAAELIAARGGEIGRAHV